MKRIAVAIIAAALSFSSVAQKLSATDGTNRVVLDTEKYCPAAVLTHIDKEFHDLFKLADVLYGGKKYKACWAFETTTGAVFIQMDDGRTIRISPDAFKELPAV